MKKIFFNIISLWLCAFLQAQNPLTNNGNLQIHAGASITSFGDFNNASAGILLNNSNLYLHGNLSNSQPAISAGTGTLYLNGSSTQSVSGTATFKTFNLNTNNASGITLNNNLSVSGTHTFAAGNIASSATPNYLIYEAGSSYTGSSDAAHVTGWVKKYGNTAFTFPTGNGTYLRDIAISNLSASMEFDAKYRGATTNSLNLQSPLVSINPSEYWTLNNITGGATTAQVTLNWNNPKVPFPNYVVPDIRSAQYIDGAPGAWTNTGGTATGLTATTGNITSSVLSIFGSLSIGSVSTIVPLRFLSITAEKKPAYTIVAWKTTNEVNVKYHEVQRSNSINGFTTIGTVPARNRFDNETYDYYDKDCLAGINYYRIKSIDIDGKIKYSKIVSVSYGESNDVISIKNNPVKTTINLSLSSNKNASFRYQIISSNGSIVQGGVLHYGGTGSLSIPFHGYMATGSYILIMDDGKIIFSKKIIVE
jgi:hypothetical protein